MSSRRKASGTGGLPELSERNPSFDSICTRSGQILSASGTTDISSPAVRS
jgi:hypothetical protein